MLHKPDSKIQVRAEKNVAVFNTEVSAPVSNNYYTVQQAPALYKGNFIIFFKEAHYGIVIAQSSNSSSVHILILYSHIHLGRRYDFFSSDFFMPNVDSILNYPYLFYH
jgi:hypothetical protein